MLRNREGTETPTASWLTVDGGPIFLMPVGAAVTLFLFIVARRSTRKHTNQTQTFFLISCHMKYHRYKK